jgi:hypothetical protein
MDVETRIDNLAAEMRERFDRHDERFDGIDARLRAIEGRFEAVDRRFEAVDGRFEAVHRRFDELEASLRAHMSMVGERLEMKVPAAHRCPRHRPRPR